MDSFSNIHGCLIEIYSKWHSYIEILYLWYSCKLIDRDVRSLGKVCLLGIIFVSESENTKLKPVRHRTVKSFSTDNIFIALGENYDESPGCSGFEANFEKSIT